MVGTICFQSGIRQPTGRNTMRKPCLAQLGGPRIADTQRFPFAGLKVSMPGGVSVLILAREELISALLGLLVEATGHSASFAEPDETSADAMRRTRPGVVIVDCDHRDCTEDLVKAAREIGARLILFSASREPDYVRKVAAPSHSKSFTFPIEPPQLDSIIRQQTA